MSWVNRFSLHGQTALVTGASRGIGQKVCEVFASAGATIIATARDVQALQQTAALVQSQEQSCHVFECDLRDSNAIEELVQSIHRAQLHVDILVNNAGVALTAPATEISIEYWQETMAVNLTAPFLLSRLLAPAMVEKKRGKVINISSQAAVMAFDGHSAYCASKAGLNGLTRSLMKEWAPHNIQVNGICPTVVLTDMGIKIWSPEEKSAPFLARTPLGRFGEPVEVADLALFLASSASDLINGESIMIEGGFSVT